MCMLPFFVFMRQSQQGVSSSIIQSQLGHKKDYPKSNHIYHTVCLSKVQAMKSLLGVLALQSINRDTLNKTTSSTGRDDQLVQLTSLLPGNIYQLRELAATSC